MSESQEQLESHPVIPPKPGYAKNRAETLQKEKAWPNEKLNEKSFFTLCFWIFAQRFRVPTFLCSKKFKPQL